MHDTRRQLGWIIWRKLIIFHPVTLDGKKSPHPKLRIGATSLKKKTSPSCSAVGQWKRCHLGGSDDLLAFYSQGPKADSEPVLPFTKNWPFPGHPNIQNVGPGNDLRYPFTHKWVRLPWYHCHAISLICCGIQALNHCCLTSIYTYINIIYIHIHQFATPGVIWPFLHVSQFPDSWQHPSQHLKGSLEKHMGWWPHHGEFMGIQKKL